MQCILLENLDIQLLQVKVLNMTTFQIKQCVQLQRVIDAK